MATAKNKTNTAARQANRAMYAPKAKPKANPALVPKDSPELIALKKIALKAMDELKMPGAVPYNVILAAMVSARKI